MHRKSNQTSAVETVSVLSTVQDWIAASQKYRRSRDPSRVMRSEPLASFLSAMPEAHGDESVVHAL